MTKRDPYVNILRTTIAAFSAGVGGADAVWCCRSQPRSDCRTASRVGSRATPSSCCWRNPTSPSRRSDGGLRRHRGPDRKALPRHLDAVPGDRSRRRCGGRAGSRLIQQDRHGPRRARGRSGARNDALTGTSDFPHLAEAPVAVLDVKPAAAKAQLWRSHSPPLPRIRLAEPFERLRDASDRCSAVRRAPENLSRQPRRTCRVHAARHLREELLRGRRYRGDHQRRLQEP